MIRAFVDHIWLLLTFRHDGSGLPRSKGLIALIFAAALVVGWLSFGYSATEMMALAVVVLAMAVLFDPVFVVSASLIAIGVGILALPFISVLGDWARFAFDIWGALAGISVGVRIGSQK